MANTQEKAQGVLQLLYNHVLTHDAITLETHKIDVILKNITIGLFFSDKYSGYIFKTDS